MCLSLKSRQVTDVSDLGWGGEGGMLQLFPKREVEKQLPLGVVVGTMGGREETAHTQ